MALELYTGYQPLINGTSLGHAQNAVGDLNMKRMTLTGMGKLEPINYSEISREPQGTFETAALKTLLDAAAINMSLTDGLSATAGDTVLQFQQAADDGGFKGAGNHFLVTSTKAFVGVSSISISQDDDKPAMASLFSHFMESTSLPFLPSDNANLTGSVTLTDWFTLGPVYVNGVELGGEMSVEFVTGLGFAPQRHGGRQVAAKGRIAGRAAEIRLGLKNLTVVDTQGFGISNAPGAVDMYLRHNNDDGRTADATAKHIKISFSAAKYEIQKLASQETGEVQSVPTLLNTGTVTHSVASTIP